MAFTPIETIALIFIAISVVKILVLSVDPKAWMNFSKKVYSNVRYTSFITFMIAAIVLNYLLMKMTIVEVMATTFFVALLMMVGLAPEAKELIRRYSGMKKGKLWKEYWFYILIWLGLMIWTVAEIFA